MVRRRNYSAVSFACPLLTRSIYHIIFIRMPSADRSRAGREGHERAELLPPDPQPQIRASHRVLHSCVCWGGGYYRRYYTRLNSQIFFCLTCITIGWIVTFIIRVRNGGPSSGYISAGFFGGMRLCFIRTHALCSFSKASCSGA